MFWRLILITVVVSLWLWWPEDGLNSIKWDIGFIFNSQTQAQKDKVKNPPRDLSYRFALQPGEQKIIRIPRGCKPWRIRDSFGRTSSGFQDQGSLSVPTAIFLRYEDGFVTDPPYEGPTSNHIHIPDRAMVDVVEIVYVRSRSGPSSANYHVTVYTK